MDVSSDQVATLKKGGSVYIDLRMDRGGKRWCGVRPARDVNRMGFVDCRTRERGAGSAPPVISGGGVASAGSLRGPASEIPIVRPAIPTQRGYDAMKNQVVKEGVIDSGFIASLESEAASGSSAVVTSAALAHLAAG